MDKSKSLLVLVGESNCGKSHTAAAIRRFAQAASFQALESGAWNNVPSIAFVRWPEVATEIRAKDRSSINAMMSEDLLILDDVGAEHDPWKEVASVLCQVLSRREKQFTVITTNIPPDRWPDQFDTRIADRFLRNSEIVDLFGVTSYALMR